MGEIDSDQPYTRAQWDLQARDGQSNTRDWQKLSSACKNHSIIHRLSGSIATARHWQRSWRVGAIPQM
eukprot:1455338-Pyramimonas_sp.AAC.1